MNRSSLSLTFADLNYKFPKVFLVEVGRNVADIGSEYS